MTWTTRQRSERGALSVIHAGRGPLVVLLHGVGLQAEAWAKQIDALAEAGFSVVAPDMPGHGQSPVLSGPATLKEYVALAGTLVTEPAVVIGHSMGAMIALELAQTQAENIRGVAALNAIYRRNSPARKAVAARATDLDGITPPDPTGPLARWFDGPCPARTACEGWLRSTDPAGYKAAYEVFAGCDGPSDSGLAGLSCPALFLTGADEPNSTPQMSLAMAAATPKGRAEILPGAAHMMPMTHPTEVNTVLLDFVTTCFEGEPHDHA